MNTNNTTLVGLGWEQRVWENVPMRGWMPGIFNLVLLGDLMEQYMRDDWAR